MKNLMIALFAMGTFSAFGSTLKELRCDHVTLVQVGMNSKSKEIHGLMNGKYKNDIIKSFSSLGYKVERIISPSDEGTAEWGESGVVVFYSVDRYAANCRGDLKLDIYDMKSNDQLFSNSVSFACKGISVWQKVDLRPALDRQFESVPTCTNE